MGCCGRCLNSKITKFILKLCFSHVGLCFIVLGYTVIGAVIFRSIEGPDEVTRYNAVVDAHHKVQQTRDSVRDQIIILAKQNVTDNPSQGKANVKQLLDQFHYVISQALYNTSNQTNVTWAGYQLGYRGEEGIPSPSYRWSLPSAMLFTATILTTIGYGHVYPITQTGYMVFLIYSVFAIPLMSMFLMSISGMLADGIRILYHRGCCFFIERKRNRTHEHTHPHHHKPNKVTDEEALRPKSAWDENEKPPVKDELNDLPESERQVADEEENSEDEIVESNQIPASLSGLVVILYLVTGTFVYSAWEGWTMVQSAYFGVVTLMTIGFGDLVPGLDRLDTTMGQVAMAFAALYIIIGLAILAMGINLIMMAMSERMRAVAQHIEDTTGLDVIDGYEGKPKKKKDEVEPFIPDENDKIAAL